jgi:allantoate deiminase
MVFVPSHHGMSHTADEWTDAQQMEKGMAALLGALLELDGAAA